MKVFTVATRGTDLAIAQTKIVIAALKSRNPDIEFDIKRIAAQGDRDQRTVLWDLKSTGFFTSQVEEVLISRQADFAVHSFKDLPTKQHKGLRIAAVCRREFPEDCVVTAKAIGSIEALEQRARIGTSSLRRAVQIKRLRKDVEIVPIRGNVPTRIKLVEQGKYDAVILARAGLERLGLGGKIAFSLPPAQFIPAPAQGALAVQIRLEDDNINGLVSAIDHKETRDIVCAERKILSATQCGCHAPVGAFAKIDGDDMIIDAFISDVKGEKFIRRQIKGIISENEKLAEALAKELLDAGGKEILENL